MEIFDPKYFFEISGLLASIITGLITLCGLIIASATYFVAKDALHEWRKEKEFDINIDGYANTLDAVKILEDLKLDQYNPEHVKDIFGGILTDIFSTGEEVAYNSFIRLFSYSKYYNELKSSMFEMRKIAIKVFNVSTDRELTDFYDKYLTIEANIFAIHHNYHISIINDFIDKYNYRKISKENYAVCIYFDTIKEKEPYTPDNEIYKSLYFHFFNNEGGDPIDGIRKQMVSFFYRKFKNKI